MMYPEPSALLLSQELVKVQTLHDKIRESIEENVQSPGPSKGTGERTGTTELHDQKSVAPVMMPAFQLGKTPSLACVPGLSTVPVDVSRGKDPLSSSIPDAETDNVRRKNGEIRRMHMSKEDQAQFYGLIAWAREDALRTLVALAWYDETLTVEQADALLVVAEIIAAAEVITP